MSTTARAAPAPGRHPAVPYVNIVLQPLEKLWEEYEYGVLERPTEESRAWLLKEQKNRPKPPLRKAPPRSAKDGVRYQDRSWVGADSDEDGFERYEREEEGPTPDIESDDSDIRIIAFHQPQVAAANVLDRLSASPEVINMRSQKIAAPQPAPKRKRLHSSSRESDQSYRPFHVRSEGESQIDPAQWGSNVGSYGWSDQPKKAKAKGNPLEAHRDYCERCQEGPADVVLAMVLQKKQRKGYKTSRRALDEDRLSEEEEVRMKGGWLECERCTVATHWGCLPDSEKRDVLSAIRAHNPDGERRKTIAVNEFATFTCARCDDHPVCFVCKERHIPGSSASLSRLPSREAEEVTAVARGEAERSSQVNTAHSASANWGKDADNVVVVSDSESLDPLDGYASDNIRSAHNTPGPVKRDGNLLKGPKSSLLFRCSRCKQAVHYEHLSDPFRNGKDYTLQALAEEYQSNNEGESWFCHLCRTWKWIVDTMIAWRPLPPEAVESPPKEGELPNYRARLPREYLVKFKDRGFRHLAWVTHDWLQVVSPMKLKHFLEKGPTLDLVTDSTLAARGDQMENPTIQDVLEDAEEQHGRAFGEQADLEAKWEGHGPVSDVNAEEAIPVDWSTVDRLLDVYLRPPWIKKKENPARHSRLVLSDKSDSDENLVELADGTKPPEGQMVDLHRWENMAGRKLTPDDADEIAPRVTWFYAKWLDLQYDQSCWDTPPPVNDERYPAFLHAVRRFLEAREVVIPLLSSRACNVRDEYAIRLAEEEPPSEQPDCVVGGKLMPFQIEGLRWLLYKHWSRESCILADDMGLGKTIQVASFLGYLCSDEHKIYPNLVVVPNSTIANWVREFEKWVPHVRAVPFYGMAASRKVISKYELYHLGKQGKADGLKAHVVLTTYDMLLGNEFRVFSNIPRWETIIVDEGQRLKSDSSLLFTKLKQLNSIHRILLTGTPLNNNLRELFNLINFLDPVNFSDLEELEMRFANLNEGLVQELHEMLKPFILRRIKSQVLKLPPKVEIIVPIAMTKTQKELTKRVLANSAGLLSDIHKKRQQQKRKQVKTQNGADADEVESGVVQSGIVSVSNKSPGTTPSKEAEPSAVVANGTTNRSVAQNDVQNGVKNGTSSNAQGADASTANEVD